MLLTPGLRACQHFITWGFRFRPRMEAQLGASLFRPPPNASSFNTGAVIDFDSAPGGRAIRNVVAGYAQPESGLYVVRMAILPTRGAGSLRAADGLLYMYDSNFDRRKRGAPAISPIHFE